ncbi:MAG: Cof-type HAD-IIB family hydrolase [Treponemataceae bacterium]|nr:Cof-type HAD-IIB family hydrolase [Treponemataceae bacterium]
MRKLPQSKLAVGIIALDLDDTLLDKNLQIMPVTVAALQSCAARGIFVVLCSGRAENAILPYVRRLDIAGTQAGRYIIAMNGATIYDMHGRRQIYARTVDGDVLLYAYREAEKRGLPCQTYDPATIYPSKDNEWTRLDVELCGLSMEVRPDFADFIKDGWSKMVIPGDPAVLQTLQADLKRALGDRAVIFVSKPYFLEIMPAHCGKGEALLELAKRLGIPPERTMAFGDSMNDESMIRLAHHGVAMRNGLPYIQEAARYVTENDNNHDGVGKFLRDWVL